VRHDFGTATIVYLSGEPKRVDRYTPLVLLAASYLLLAAQKGVAAKWQTQTFSEGVSLEVPIVLKKTSQALDDPRLKSFDLWVGIDGQTSYLISISRYREPQKIGTPSLFSASVAGLMDGVKGKMVGQRDLVLQGWPGLATTLRSADGLTMAVRTFRTQDLVIQFGGMFLTARGRPPKLDRFLNSLKLPEQGELKEPGAALTRYPLGESGLSALFPEAPQMEEIAMGNRTKTVPMFAYKAEYARRAFSVAYLDIPSDKEPSDAELDKGRYDFTELILSLFKAKKGKQADKTVGDIQGLFTEYTIADEAEGRIFICFLGTRVVVLSDMAPCGYDAPKTIETFFKSLQTAPTKGAN
jgi:hypothetical protein